MIYNWRDKYVVSINLSGFGIYLDKKKKREIRLQVNTIVNIIYKVQWDSQIW